MEKEIRNYNLELRADKESRVIEGYAAIFDSASRDMGFIEYIDRGAFDGVLERSDVFAVLNHDNNKILARSNKGAGSLELTIDDKGLKYRFEAPHNDLGNSVLEYIRRNELSESSFAFTVDTDAWNKESDGTYIRHITKIDRLFDVSPVWTAAYAATSVSCRSFEEFKAKEEEEAKAEAIVEEMRNGEEEVDLSNCVVVENEEVTETRSEEEKVKEEVNYDDYYRNLKEDLKEYLN